MAGTGYAFRLEARDMVRALDAATEGVGAGFGGLSGELVLKRAALLEAAYGHLLPAGALEPVIPNALGERGSPADA